MTKLYLSKNVTVVISLNDSRGLTLQTRLRGNGWFMGPIQEQLSF